MNDEQLWRLRAEALLPVLKAAIGLTHGNHFELLSKSGDIIVPKDRYRALQRSVQNYLDLAEQESSSESTIV